MNFIDSSDTQHPGPVNRRWSLDAPIEAKDVLCASAVTVTAFCALFVAQYIWIARKGGPPLCRPTIPRQKLSNEAAWEPLMFIRDDVPNPQFGDSKNSPKTP